MFLYTITKFYNLSNEFDFCNTAKPKGPSASYDSHVARLFV